MTVKNKLPVIHDDNVFMFLGLGHDGEDGQGRLLHHTGILRM